VRALLQVPTVVGVGVEHVSPVPVYRQIAAMLRARIESGELAPGMPLPSEVAVMQETGVARDTVRKAVALLRDEGLVITVQGKGTFVVDRT
jgi:GntR family transcriptional regulator